MSAPHEEQGVTLGRFHEQLADGRVCCRLCPRACTLHEGQRGFCYIRERRGSDIWLTSYGRASGFCIDPIEKKPLNHFYPGSSVLSFGTAGCNLGCRFCQNWDISKARSTDRLGSLVSPSDIAQTAHAWNCESVAFTYNDPVIFAEFAIDTAEACRERGVRTVAVTAGYITPAAREPFFSVMDAANVDLKAFTPEFYRKLCAAEIDVVKDNLKYLVHHTSVWIEVTTLLIPGHNDSDDEIRALAHWMKEELGSGVPLHFSAFHPDYRMPDVPCTPKATCQRAREIARDEGLLHVYTGNIDDPEGQSTYCPSCSAVLLERRGYDVRALDWHAGACGRCGHVIAGRFSRGEIGKFGSQRIPIDVPSRPSQPRWRIV
ncbi:MAG TPA: AmmeMemoRadiSam system radical SAM enzyme [Polyangiaceae bacterium]|nr:AmmeMemoRadiSam system radical SAM enzyme [Polyangiaceae bacterium]